MSIEQQPAVDRTELWREFHGKHIERQTSAIESIKTILLVWTWLTVAGFVLFVILSASAASNF